MAKYYIDQEALFQALTDKFKARLASSHLPTWNDAFDTVKSIPADVLEWKTGEWIEDGYYNELCVCSYCGVPGDPGWNFCPKCGAKMRKGD